MRKKRANKHANKRMIYWAPFWNKVYERDKIRVKALFTKKPRTSLTINFEVIL